MAWDYRYTGHKVIQHKAGTVPPRPLEVGDTVHFDAGDAHVVWATTPTLLRFDDVPRSFLRFRKPIEGDDSDSIFAEESVT